MDDVDQICRLKYAYFRSLDLKQWKEFEGCFVEDATGSYAELEFSSRRDIVDYMKANLPLEVTTVHQAHHPEIDVDGDTATGTWYLFDKVFVPAFDFVLEGAAFYSDRYVRTEQGWRIQHTGYRRTYETSWKMSKAPGWSFKRGTAYDA